MTQSSDFKIRFLEIIGVPVLSAILDMQGRDSMPEDDSKAHQKTEAQYMAALLGQSVTFGARLSDMLAFEGDDTEAESMRLALGGLAAKLMIEAQKKNGFFPDEAGMKRLMTAMETALMFADNFTPDETHIARLTGLDEDGVMRDEAQINMQYVSAMVPVVVVVADYAFGRDEKKLVLDISDKLSKAAADLVQAAAASDNAGDHIEQKAAERAALRTLVPLYTACHKEETARMMAMDDEARARLSAESGDHMPMTAVWENFATRLAMMKALTGIKEQPAPNGIMPDEAAQEREASAAPPPEQDMQTGNVVDDVEDNAQEDAPPQDEKQENNDNPMSFFSKKRTGGEDTQGGTSV